MADAWFDAIARLVAKLSSRRAAVLSLGGTSILSVLSDPGLGTDDAAAKKKRKNTKRKKRKKRKKGRCKSPKGKCGKKCVPLNTNQNCGRCGNACTGDKTCRGDVCCAVDLCRGECRPNCPPPTANRPFPHHVPYVDGSIKPTNFNQGQLDHQVRAAYDRWKARYLVREDRDTEGNQVFRIAFGKPGTRNSTQTVSEGQGWGMIIMATMAGYEDEAREMFDGLWRFRLAHPSAIDPRLMDWKVPEGGGNDSAFDGDADIAYGLLLADTQWGSDGLIDYLGEAQSVIAGITASTIGPDSNLPLLGDWVRGQPDSAKFNQYTPRTSDFMPGHFRAFRGATGDGAWTHVIAACQGAITTLQETFSQNAGQGPDLTGLLPDFVQPVSVTDHAPRPASPGFLEQHDGDYSYNAGRDPWRLGTDALLNEDGTSGDQAALIANWANVATGGNPRVLRAGYRLDGTTWPDTDYFTTFFAAPIGVAAMTDASLQEWLNAIYEAVYDVQEDYYEDTVTLLCLLVMSGNFWTPPT